MNTTLLIMAAGMGSRFGGNKQIARMGPHGEILVEYSVHDAIAAGFDKVVFVIKRSMEADFRQLIGDKLEKKVQVHYAFQEFDSLPGGFVPPEGRVKPYGTVHAVLAAKDVIQEPFAVINADDFYGREAFFLMAENLRALREQEGAAAMVRGERVAFEPIVVPMRARVTGMTHTSRMMKGTDLSRLMTTPSTRLNTGMGLSPWGSVRISSNPRGSPMA